MHDILLILTPVGNSIFQGLKSNHRTNRSDLEHHLPFRPDVPLLCNLMHLFILWTVQQPGINTQSTCKITKLKFYNQNWNKQLRLQILNKHTEEKGANISKVLNSELWLKYPGP